MNRRILMTDATDAELLQFARSTLALNLPPNTKRPKLLARISAAWNQDHINLPVTEEADAPQKGSEPAPVTAEQQAPDKRMVRINIPISEDAGGSDAVPVGVNGSVMLIPRGKDVDVPYSYYEVLTHAIKHVYDVGEDGLGMNPVPREVPTYPFQVIGELPGAVAA